MKTKQGDERWTKYHERCTQCWTESKELTYVELVGAWPPAQYLCPNCMKELKAAQKVEEDKNG